MLPLVELSHSGFIEVVSLYLLELKLPDLSLELGLLGVDDLELPEEVIVLALDVLVCDKLT